MTFESHVIGITWHDGFNILIEFEFFSAVTITLIFFGKYLGNQNDTFASLCTSNMSLKLSIPSNINIT